MGGAQHQMQQKIHVQEEAKEQNSPQNANVMNHQPLPPPPKLPEQHKNYMWWLRMAVYSFLVLSTQAVATLLGRLYFAKGGSGKWTATLVQLCGFPILLPFLLFSPNTPQKRENNRPNAPSSVTLASLYLCLGVFLAANCMLYSIGLLYLPVSTYSLICATQLGFNALFSYFLNSQKITPFIINSLVILTISSTLLVFQNDSSSSNKVSRGKYAIGFLSTVGASAGYALLLSVTQLAFRKILKQENFRVVLNMVIYQSLVATIVILVGLFGSGEWKGLTKEMDGFELGRVSYVMTLVWTAISWTLFSIGALGLIFEVSSLFSNVVSTLGLPIIPVAAVFVFHDTMGGIKVVALLLAIWGFVSYIYQSYLDELESKTRSDQHDNGVSEVSLAERA
ncbi:hypothetical protein RHMOL_Rhmol13G0257200 [Rhododendron molle]|uniref:Uncharacterized protein n=1 Tax=Rhododendron molle TaxID=49168 RepID=A0ACC0LB52_RHOML|nr:hypothetical protein RHMOL_Rhmol13G0257200 [Rhododendron molle]